MSGVLIAVENQRMNNWRQLRITPLVGHAMPVCAPQNLCMGGGEGCGFLLHVGSFGSQGAVIPYQSVELLTTTGAPVGAPI
jgi:hypothetical protein